MEESTSIWTEKYRPKTFVDIKGQDEIVAKLSAFVKQRNIPHLLFAGPPGVGKSTIALVLARSFFGENYRDNFLELNSSDERGIDVVRNKVKDFARTKALGDVPFKIIFLDECDALTKEAQQALRRTMENYTSSCRFVLAANYSSKILDPIQSRCAVFRFRPLPKEKVYELIDHVIKGE
ncbi:AAA family ATPase, partial [Candidatus Woesearchaeota archaeon]|nr:AAA family ATPase [Candidatus Woesearchaeota archaeon]